MHHSCYCSNILPSLTFHRPGRKLAAINADVHVHPSSQPDSQSASQPVCCISLSHMLSLLLRLFSFPRFTRAAMLPCLMLALENVWSHGPTICEYFMLYLDDGIYVNFLYCTSLFSVKIGPTLLNRLT